MIITNRSQASVMLFVSSRKTQSVKRCVRSSLPSLTPSVKVNKSYKT